MILSRRYKIIGLPTQKVDKKPIVTKKRYKNIIAGKPITPSNLTLLMYNLYEQKNLVPILPQKSQYRLAKEFIGLVGKERAVELMFFAASVCNRIWTFKYLIKIAKENIDDN